jgi:hypothetical protein
MSKKYFNPIVAIVVCCIEMILGIALLVKYSGFLAFLFVTILTILAILAYAGGTYMINLFGEEDDLI